MRSAESTITAAVFLLEALVHFHRIVLAWLNPRACRYQYARPKEPDTLLNREPVTIEISIAAASSRGKWYA